MKPIEFPEVNVTYAKDQPQYQPLPVFKDADGTVISCWKLSFKERMKLLRTGELWISMLTFNKPLTPLYPTVNKEEVLILKTESDDKGKVEA